MEMANEQADVILMVPEPESRLRFQYRSLRRQVFFIQSFCVLFCVTCCIFTLMYHANQATCKGNGVEEPSKTEMHHQEPNQRSKTFIHLTVNNSLDVNSSYVPWMSISSRLHPNNTGYFTLAEDGKSLKVQHTGAYKVSLQITYRGNNKHNGTVLQQDIYRETESYGGIMLLLTSFETVSQESTLWTKSLFSEGIFSLEAGDKLMVSSQNMFLIDKYAKFRYKNVLVAHPHF